MERMSVENQKGILYLEHIQRYEFVKPFIQGNVLDIACGIGYGSQILKDAFKNYTGMDYSDKAIESANRYFTSEHIKFVKGDITNIESANESFDTVVSFETLEHIIDYQKAISEITRVLKKDGIFIGSVPSFEYDEICEKVYGKNPYHVTRFEFAKIRDALSKKFKYVKFFSNQLIITNIFRDLDSEGNEYQKVLSFKSISKSDNLIYGSILFFATNNRNLFDTVEKRVENVCIALEAMVEYDHEKVIPLHQIIGDQTKMIDERDEAIRKQALMINERDEAMRKQAYMIDERDKAIQAQAKLIDERDEYIKELERKLNGH